MWLLHYFISCNHLRRQTLVISITLGVSNFFWLEILLLLWILAQSLISDEHLFNFSAIWCMASSLFVWRHSVFVDVGALVREIVDVIVGQLIKHWILSTSPYLL